MPTTAVDAHAPLRMFARSHQFFVGIDSDGCAFDTMEVKHKECFIPNTVRFYGLAAVAKYAREAWEFVNLYSTWRGMNRFPALVRTFDLLAARPEVARRSFAVPALAGVRRWIEAETTLANSTLRARARETGDIDLAQALEWSEAVNRSVGEIVRSVPPFPLVRESLESLQGKADVMVVSATPGEALRREWAEHGLANMVGLIAGQEEGSKQDHLALAAAGHYARDRMLMIGDAPGDRLAAQAAGALFYPIVPGQEDLSWRRLFDSALPRFFAGTYAGPYMDEQIAHFEALLPAIPPWQLA
jgi:phosphoglycolate phosphatase-like HAD superfamily hydrolase